MILQRLNSENKYEKFDSENPTVILGTKKDGTPYKGIVIFAPEPVANPKSETAHPASSAEAVLETPKPNEEEINDKKSKDVDKIVEKPKEPKPKPAPKEKKPVEEKKKLSEWLALNKIVIINEDPLKALSLTTDSLIDIATLNSAIAKCMVRHVG